MMPDLREQLREYGSFLDESAHDTRLRRNGPPAPGARFDDAAPDLDRLEPMGAETMVVDLESLRGERTGRRRWLIAAAAVVAAVLLVAGTVLVTGSGGHDVRTGEPASQTPSTTPLTSLDAVLPPEGATPSTPETGELVAAIAFSRSIDGSIGFPDADRWRDTSIKLYADGRLIRLPAPDTPGWIAEQRLNAEGVDLVRSAFLSTGLLDAGQTTTDIWWSCECFIWLRDNNGRLVQSAWPSPQQVDSQAARANVDPKVKGEVDRLVEFLTHLDSSLPASAWADHEIRAYVPSRYGVCVRKAPKNPLVGRNNRPVPHLSKVLNQLLPTQLVRLLDEPGGQHLQWGECVELTTGDARAVAEGLIDAGAYPAPWTRTLVVPSWMVAPVSPEISIDLVPFLPDGVHR
jgi:hypothetical protein